MFCNGIWTVNSTLSVRLVSSNEYFSNFRDPQLFKWDLHILSLILFIAFCSVDCHLLIICHAVLPTNLYKIDYTGI